MLPELYGLICCYERIDGYNQDRANIVTVDEDTEQTHCSYTTLILLGSPDRIEIIKT